MGNKVLLVDDDEKLRKLVTEYLEGYGFEVRALPDALSVLSTIRNESPDIVILDIMLPGKDGLEVLKEIRSELSVPVIMLIALWAWSWGPMTTCRNPLIPVSC